MKVKVQKEEIEQIDQIKSQVFNNLYNFFSRYYEEGDFIPQYRYSIKGHKYAIPYNGEEVKLYWVNQDQLLMFCVHPLEKLKFQKIHS